MTTRVRALYDFSGEPNTSELTILAGEILTLSRTDVGEGWWEGTNSHGLTGLFPEAYVELYKEQPVSAAAPIIHHQPAAAATPPQNQPGSRYDPPDDWNESDSDWGEDEETYSEIGPPKKQQQPATQQQSNYANVNLPATPADDTVSIASANATLKKSGIFSKAGDSYILGTYPVAVADNDRVFITHADTGYFWNPNRNPYTVRVTSPKKETKLGGLKKFIAYQLTPSFNNIAVSRRYKHFDWLHERLVDKYCLIPIPPLPDKQISGRYEEQFVEHRRVQLQEFVDWVCRHPVLSLCEVWMHFLTCTDEKRWKVGKRAAERDPLVGFTYCAAIFPPEKQLLQSQVDVQTDNCNQFVHTMDNAVKLLLNISNEQIKRFQMQSKKDFQRIGESFSELARALDIDERRAITNVNLSTSVAHVAGVFNGIRQMHGEQPEADWIPFCDRLHIYRGVLSGFPDVLAAQRGAMQKKKECEKLTAEQKMGNAQLQEVNRRTDVMSYAVLAEMNHFRQERDVHLKDTISTLIKAQILFYQDIVSKLQEAQRHLDSI